MANGNENQEESHHQQKRAIGNIDEVNEGISVAKAAFETWTVYQAWKPEQYRHGQAEKC